MNTGQKLLKRNMSNTTSYSTGNPSITLTDKTYTIQI